MKLSKSLADLKSNNEKKIPAEKWAIMERSTQELKESSLIDHVIQKGKTLPEFKLSNQKNEQVSLTDFQDDFLVVSFYRGGWCPYCNLELRALQGVLPKLRELNADLIAISPETPDNSLTTTEKNELSFSVLSDIDNLYAKSLGLVFQMPEDLSELYHSFGLHVDKHNGNEDYELPMPATFVLNRERKIIYSFVAEDYTVRLDPDRIIEVITEAANIRSDLSFNIDFGRS
ncbi:peroxiredoxin-like family protein [Reichenbachiella versicolor]|uniref:peroxiredoxin-like family protein n=1 Tax=Reichenbachiella versicolor TaxID=1821036 RepID=UPI000D6E9A7B|nr:peroxiredoxin-like family protein [Reichenbachiella versicolor]